MTVHRHSPYWQRIAAGIGLGFTAPLLGAAAIMIKAVDAGPVLYRATRAGVGGRPFVMLKLRTMRTGFGGQGSITGSDDQRILPAARLLRRLKIDELPQLINVVRGDMAIVGPRPEAIDIVRQHYQPWMMETLDVPPGITGPGSLHYAEQERQLPREAEEALPFYVSELLPEKLAYELVFVRSRSLGYELQLIMRTVCRIVGFQVDGRWGRIEAEGAQMILAEVSRSEV